jgi:hypothetical protein
MTEMSELEKEKIKVRCPGVAWLKRIQARA